MGPISDDPPINSMASSNFNNALEKGTTLAFGLWIYVMDGSGSFTSHLVDAANVEPNSTNQAPLMNDSTTQVVNAKNSIEDP